MSITRYNPNTVFLGGDRTQVGDIATAAILTPGMLVQRDNVGGIIRWKVAAADIAGPPAVVTEMAMLNKGVDDNYAVGDLVEVSVLHKGGTAWMFIASGAAVEAGDLLGSLGTSGQLKLSATVSLFTALENKTATAALTRIRVEAL